MSQTPQTPPLRELRQVSKSFGAVQALKDVDFVAPARLVTALVGDNGAGKSTLIKCIGGIYPFDHGQILFEGKEVMIHSPMEIAAGQTLRDLNVTTLKSLRTPVASLSGGQRQSVAVAKAVLWKSKLAILDEPTAALGVAQTAQVLALVRRLAESGLGVILISHNLNDVFAVADRISVLHLGRMVADVATANVDSQEVVELITTGRSRRQPGLAVREET